MIQKPSIPKGVRDFSALDIERRAYITETIRRSFKKFCFDPIETPAFENISTLMGKYGEEGDRLIFKILNSGDFLEKVDEASLTGRNSAKAALQISEKALRYDLTVPFSRYVSMHKNELTFPFKRYQIQPVWRADRPQKGRFREFYQCDADVVGAASIFQEIELLELYRSVFADLRLPVTIKINHRKILSGLARQVGLPDERLTDFTVALDKLDKIGKQGVIDELSRKNIGSDSLQAITPLLDFSGNSQETLGFLKQFLKADATAKQGIDELEFVLQSFSALNPEDAILEADLALARGLNYYTGCIFEVRAKDVAIGSIGGGGRYDNLTEGFGFKDASGVGISFGLDRICLALEELNLFPSDISVNKRIFFVNFGATEALQALKIIRELRQKGMEADLYPESSKPAKQLAYAAKKGYPWVALIGSEELKSQKAIVKDMFSGAQSECDLSELSTFFGEKVIGNI